MKRTPSRRSDTRAAATLPIVAVLSVCLISFVLAEIPAWWGERHVLKTDSDGNPVESVDFAAANQGQLKQFAVATYEEFLAKIPAALGGIGAVVPPPDPALPEGPTNRGSPGWRIRNLISQWIVLNEDGSVRRDAGGKRILTSGATSSKDFAAINLGQIKAVAAPFYDRLAELYWAHNKGTPETSQIDPAWAKPWTGAPEDANDHAMATLGQLKNTFAIRLESDGDGDGLTNLQELLANKNRGSTPDKWTDLGNARTTGGVITDGEQVTLSLDPTLEVNGRPPSAPTGLHVTFRDALVHPLDPDLSQIKIEWDAPVAENITVSFSKTYAGDSDGWHPVTLTDVTSSPDINVEYSKRIYQYRVTFTAPNQLTASADISYELPVIRGIMQRTNQTDFAFRGAILYPDAAHLGVPRKFTGFKYEWSIDAAPGYDAYHFTHEHGNYTQQLDLSARKLTTGNENHLRSDYQTAAGITYESHFDDVVNTRQSIQPFPLLSSRIGGDSWKSDWNQSDVDYLGIDPETSYERLIHSEEDWNATWQRYPLLAADGTSLPARPIITPSGNYQRSDTEKRYNLNSISGNSALGTLSLASDDSGQHYGWAGNETNTSGSIGAPQTETHKDISGPGGRHRSAWAFYPLHPGEFSVIGTYEPPFFEVVRHGAHPVPEGAEVTSTTENDGTKWSRKWDVASGPNKEKWEETVTLSGEITTTALLDAAVGSMAPFDAIQFDWYQPYPPADQQTLTNTSFTGGSSAGIDWRYTASYVSGTDGVNWAVAGYPDNGYVTIPPSLSGLVGKYSLSVDENSGQLLSSDFKFRIYPPAEATQIQWLETLGPDPAFIGPFQLQHKIRSLSVSAYQTADTPVQTVNRTQGYAPQADPQALGPKGQVTVGLLRVQIVELSPKLRDDNNGEIAGSQNPSPLPLANGMVERVPATNQNDASTIRIAWRDLKVKVDSALSGKKVTWSMLPLFIPTYTPAFRGKWGWAVNAQHRNRFSESTAYGAHNYTVLTQLLETGTNSPVTVTASTTIDDGGFSAIRVNLPPIGFNKARIKVQIEGSTAAIEIIDLEVPAIVTIDPGHGGNDSGNVLETVTPKLYERDLTLLYSNELKTTLEKKIREQGHSCKILVGKQSNPNRSKFANELRARLARDQGADIHLALHFNGGGPSSCGTQVYILSVSEGNVNRDQDLALASRMYAAGVAAFGAGNRDPAQRIIDLVAGKDGRVFLRDTPSFLNNVPGSGRESTFIRAVLLELEYLTTAGVANKLTGPNATTTRQNYGVQAAQAIVNDLLNQP